MKDKKIKEELILCPNCSINGIKMQKTKCGQDLILDKCPECMGLWFDREELADLIKLGVFYMKHLDQIPSKSSHKNNELSCPHCRVPLNKAMNNKIPGLKLDKCPKCTGLWIEQGELLKIVKFYS